MAGQVYGETSNNTLFWLQDMQLFIRAQSLNILQAPKVELLAAEHLLTYAKRISHVVLAMCMIRDRCGTLVHVPLWPITNLTVPLWPTIDQLHIHT